jgi:CheY-like chemotaxis protein
MLMNAPLQKVVIVNGTNDALELLETTLTGGHYDIMFVESARQAYGQIRRVQPNLVILYMPMNDVDSFQALSMLKLDAETRQIPIVTYTAEFERETEEEEPTEMSDFEFPVAKSAIRMN